MVPNNSGALKSVFLDTNRHSSRIFNKTFIKFDVSMANDKIGFMRSLDLFYVKNTKEFGSKLNWEEVSSAATLPLKECSVVLTDISYNTRSELCNNGINFICYKNLHHQFNVNKCKNVKIRKQQIIKRTCSKLTDTKSLKNTSKIESIKCNVGKRKNNSSVTFKVTLKIGSEVISKKYCKKKYFSKESPYKRIVNKMHQDIDCEKCNDIKDSLYNSRVRSDIANCHQDSSKSPQCESYDQNVFEDKWLMAAALVELEIQRHRSQYMKSPPFENNMQYNDERKNIDNNNVDGDAAVSEARETIPLSTITEDDIQEVLRIKKNAKKNCNKSTNTLQRNRLTTNNNDEIITIDDNCDDLMDDCVIIGESLSEDYLKDYKENHCPFYMMDTEKQGNKKNSCFNDGRNIVQHKLHHSDSQILALSTKNNPSLQSSCNKSYEISRFKCNKLIQY
ncbi:uncharacterized protein LOC131675076 [Phymastichus coffea]|uniref:uncharacterized protein LOC131675076 n=1 Tax=Phymastichus coffea TaxID=108790 RepID=UPI00273C5BA0|nr:uncharacterized protein LOC131675076 [Phymastichus coffea]XP_058809903.1 uncharacterized protein LOC131675076 [Phymastichus coffea]XP_058809904.1 uncharacterized protein LOC131675076 [Phymastichus coffea]XP_058809905.1 uncharacterized protein LOC131675076 [Phymastichus coffea]